MTNTMPSACAVPLTPAQQAAVAKLAYALEAPGAVVLLCGPAGVGKTLVLARVAGTGAVRGRNSVQCRLRDGVPPDGDHDSGGERILLVDDAHEAVDGQMASLLDAWRRREPRGGIVLAGEGRLLTLVARDARIEQAVLLRVALVPFTLAESRIAVESRLTAVAESEREPLVRTIHEIAGGIPARVVGLADLVGVVAEATPERRVTSADVEALHRRLQIRAA